MLCLQRPDLARPVCPNCSAGASAALASEPRHSHAISAPAINPMTASRPHSCNEFLPITRLPSAEPENWIIGKRMTHHPPGYC